MGRTGAGTTLTPNLTSLSSFLLISPGKSSLTKVLFRLDDPFEGTIRIDGEVDLFSSQLLSNYELIVGYLPVWPQGFENKTIDYSSRYNTTLTATLTHLTHKEAVSNALPLTA